LHFYMFQTVYIAAFDAVYALLLLI